MAGQAGRMMVVGKTLGRKRGLEWVPAGVDAGGQEKGCGDPPESCPPLTPAVGARGTSLGENPQRSLLEELLL